MYLIDEQSGFSAVNPGAVERPLSKKYTLFRNEFCFFSKVSIPLLKNKEHNGK